MVRITQDDKNNIKVLIEKGLTKRNISFKLKIPEATIGRHAKKMNLKFKGKAGRHKILSERDEKFCVNQISTRKSKSVVQLQKEMKRRFNIEVSTFTLSRTLKKNGLQSGEKKKKPLLSAKNIKARLEFARKHEDWTADDWNRVIFSDETKINRFNSDGRTWFWSRDPNVLNNQTVQQTVKHGGGRVMMWGCMCSKGIGYACKIDNTMDQHLYKEILEDDLLKTIEYYNLDSSKIIFQHDNDPKHTAKSVKEWIKQQDFQTMLWPAQSPDLNPIEHLWAHVKRMLNQFPTPAKGMNELWERIEKVWNEIDSETCAKLINSMPSRIRAVLKAKGKWTRY
jgi:transposase